MHESEAELISTSYEFDRDLVNPDSVQKVKSLTSPDLLESKKPVCASVCDIWYSPASRDNKNSAASNSDRSTCGAVEKAEASPSCAGGDVNGSAVA